MQILDNIIWHTLTGPHTRFALGDGAVRRYAPGFSPIVGFADPSRPDFPALRAHCAPGEQLFCSGWSGAAPEDWDTVFESTMFQMVWEAAAPDADSGPEPVAIGPEHGAQALELATLTHPGPFGPRTIELGQYLGIFDGHRLVAMAGERMHAGNFREISGVCTHPEYQGKGLARRLMRNLLRRQMQRGEMPFLHVVSENDTAHALYQSMGFRDRVQTVVRVVSLR